jgi:DNA-binding NarL/FixJ family response regulator
LATSSFRILIVDDYEPWRRVISWLLRGYPEWEIVGEAADGMEAVRKAEELQPDVILLDIGLPKLHGIEVANSVRRIVPQAKMLFVSVNLCPEVVQGALKTGAHGYIVKSDAAKELLDAMRAVLSGRRFVGARFAEHDFVNSRNN